MTSGVIGASSYCFPSSLPSAHQGSRCVPAQNGVALSDAPKRHSAGHPSVSADSSLVPYEAQEEEENQNRRSGPSAKDLEDNTLSCTQYQLGSRDFLPAVKPVVGVPLTLCIAFCPLLVMVVFISGMHNVFVAMVAMHWFAMALLPLLYVRIVERSFSYYRFFFRQQRRHLHLQLRWGILGFMCSGAFVFCVYLLAKCSHWNSSFCVHMKDNALQEGFRVPIWLLALFGVYFTTMNPVVEECFWRVFLYRELGGLLFVNAVQQILYTTEADPLLPCSLRRRYHHHHLHDHQSHLQRESLFSAPSQSQDAACGVPQKQQQARLLVCSYARSGDPYYCALVLENPPDPDLVPFWTPQPVGRSTTSSSSGTPQDNRSSLLLLSSGASIAPPDDDTAKKDGNAPEKGGGRDGQKPYDGEEGTDWRNSSSRRNGDSVESCAINRSSNQQDKKEADQIGFVWLGSKAASRTYAFPDGITNSCSSSADTGTCSSATEDGKPASGEDGVRAWVVHGCCELGHFYDLQLTCSGKFLLSVLYASYHACVIYHLLGALEAAVVCVALASFGQLLLFVRNHPRLGLLTAVMTHAGVDLGATLAYANVFLSFI